MPHTRAIFLGMGLMTLFLSMTLTSFKDTEPLVKRAPSSVQTTGDQKVKEPLGIGHLRHVDTTVAVYGPYVAVKLPITKGVNIANPIQLKLGPEGVLYGANQTGEVYSLRDTDGDGLEDKALLYCNVRDFGLRSPSGFAHRGDTIYIGTAQQIRAFLDTDKDGKADTSWPRFYKHTPQ